MSIVKVLRQKVFQSTWNIVQVDFNIIYWWNHCLWTMILTMCKPNIVLYKSANQILSCTTQYRPCANYLSPHANSKISSIPIYFANSWRLPVYFVRQRLLRAAHFWFNLVKSLLRVKKSLLRFTWFTLTCPQRFTDDISKYIACMLVVLTQMVILLCIH
jgi:hypothetical protein